MPYTLQKDSIYQYNSQNKWDGAVVFLFVEDSIFLIQRSDTMPTHAGQVAFVGGHKKDGENPVETAKREFVEETSLDASLLEELQILEPQFTSNQNIIYPVLAKIKMSKVKFLNETFSRFQFESVSEYDMKLTILGQWAIRSHAREIDQGLLLRGCPPPAQSAGGP